MKLVSGQVSSQLKLVRLQHENINISVEISTLFDFLISGQGSSGKPSTQKHQYFPMEFQYLLLIDGQNSSATPPSPEASSVSKVSIFIRKDEM